MATQIIPLTSDPNQTLTTTVSIDDQNITLNLTLRYNETAEYWILSIVDSENNMLLDSVPVITGLYPAANILEQYSYLKIGSVYVINAGSSVLDYPDSETLGTDFVLVWSDTA